ncbi:hypothetical protein GHT06_017334 [Daphnia sinensis]|uniref:Uncharacterized protein n=1 Tax=Daphnia sinensis TaxID=1820382 RepID=A0AAD5PRT2_9CRUS|nr:hypothetical protein GHT06_017334 [Daphnia sinensis]
MRRVYRLAIKSCSSASSSVQPYEQYVRVCCTPSTAALYHRQTIQLVLFCVCLYTRQGSDDASSCVLSNCIMCVCLWDFIIG